MPATLKKDFSESVRKLYLAFDLGDACWTLAFTTGLAQPPRKVQIIAGSMERLEGEIARAKRRFGLPEDAVVVSCYEAGREAFWLHRWLEAHQVCNVVIDSSSIEVNRRQRRPKSDRIDVGKLLKLLMRSDMGEDRVFSVVRVPSIDEEDERHLHRELRTLTTDETAIINRIRGVLAGLGMSLEPDKNFPQRLKNAKQWNGDPLPPGVRRRLLADFAVLQAVRGQIRELERVQKAEIREGTGYAAEPIRKLMSLRAVGIGTASIYAKEFFAWRKLDNRRQVAALAGLCSTPYRSGQMRHEQGISKAGNRWVRGIAVEFAWSWLRWQPESALSRWYMQRFARAGGRQRRVGIVALARKLLVALWKFVKTGTPPEGAILVEWEGKLSRRKGVAIA